MMFLIPETFEAIIKVFVKQLLYYKNNQESVRGILETAKDRINNKFDVNVVANRIYEFLKSKWIIKKREKTVKISILSLVFPYPKIGIMPGVESYVESIAVPLKQLGYDVRIITSFWNGRKKLDIYKGIPIIRIYDSRALLGKIGSIFHMNNFTFGLNLLSKKISKYYIDSDVIIIPLAIGFTKSFKFKKIPIISYIGSLFAQIQGVPLAIASKRTCPNPSNSEGWTKISQEA